MFIKMCFCYVSYATGMLKLFLTCRFHYYLLLYLWCTQLDEIVISNIGKFMINAEINNKCLCLCCENY